MGLKMKNFNIVGVYQSLGEGGHKKQYIGGNCLKRGLGQFAGGLSKKRGEDVFEGGWIPQCTLWLCSGTYQPEIGLAMWMSWIGQDLSCSTVQRKKLMRRVLLDLNLIAE